MVKSLSDIELIQDRLMGTAEKCHQKAVLLKNVGMSANTVVQRLDDIVEKYINLIV